MSASLVWVDLETTGLDPNRDRIIEVAVVLTNDNLDVLRARSWPVRLDWRGRRRLARNPYVTAMHRKSGLLAELHRGLDLRLVDAKASGTVQAWCDNRKVPLAGSSVHFDRAFIERHMPYLAASVTHRNVDASSLYELTQRGHLTQPASGKGGGTHRALADVLDSIRLAKECLGMEVAS